MSRESKKLARNYGSVMPEKLAPHSRVLRRALPLILFFSPILLFQSRDGLRLSRYRVKIWKTGQNTSLRVYGSTFEITREQLRIPGKKACFQFCCDNSSFALFY